MFCFRLWSDSLCLEGLILKYLFLKVKLNAPWWLDVIQRSIRCSYDDDLVSRVKNELTCSYKQQAHKFSMADK